MNQDWLDSLKEGDEVALKSYAGWSRAEPNYKITKVIKITPTRRIKVAAYGNCQFDSKGRPYGSSMKGVRLIPYDQEVKDAIKKKDLINKINKVKYEELSLDQLELIFNVSHKSHDEKLFRLFDKIDRVVEDSKEQGFYHADYSEWWIEEMHNELHELIKKFVTEDS